MNDQVEQIKSKVDIVEVIGERVALKKAGRHFKGLCPFHSEKSPSFIVSPERQSYKCFGCQKYGDVLTFLQDYDGMSFLEALEMLAKRVGITLESYRPTSQDSYRKRLLEIMSLGSEYYHYLLTKHKSGEEARGYLKSRGITNEAITQFNLGYAPRAWRSVSDFLIQKKKYTPEELEAVGLVIRKQELGNRNVANHYYDRFRGRVVFPLKDHKGLVVGFSGRTLSSEPSEAKYINSPETQLYSKSRLLYGLYENREYIRKADAIVLTEGELDVIPSWQAGVKQTVAIKGSAFTMEQAQLIARFTHNITMSLDADTAGQDAVKRAVNIADSMDMNIKVVQIVGGKDPGDIARDSAKAWREMVKGATPYLDFLINSAVARHDPQTGEGAKTIAGEVVPALSQLTNSVVRAHYTTALAMRLGVPEESIYSEIERHKKKQQLNHLKQTVSQIEKGQTSRREEVEEYLLALGLYFFDQVAPNFARLETVWISTRAIAKIMDILKSWDDKAHFTIKALGARLPAELQSILTQAYTRDLSQISDPVREWGRVAQEVQAMYVKAELKMLSSEIATAEASGAVTKTLQERFASLSRQLSG